MAGSSDTQAPTLGSLSLSSSSIILSGGPNSITVTARILDDISGVFDGTFTDGSSSSPPQIRLRSPSGQLVDGLFDILHPVSGDRLDGVYTATATFGAYAETGQWAAQYVFLMDEAGNQKFLMPADSSLVAAASLTVTNSNSDTHVPTLEALSLSSPTLTITSSPSTVTVTARFTDDISGVFDGTFTDGSSSSSPQIRLRSPSGQFVDGVFDILHPVSGDRLDGVYAAAATFDAHSETGQWTAQYVFLIDEAGNQKFLMPADSSLVAAASLTVTNSNSDTHVPTLEALSLSSPTLTITSGSSTVTVTARFTDDISGVFDGTYADGSGDSPPQIRLRSPSGQFVDGLFDILHPVSGDRLDGVYTANLTFNANAEQGTWRAEYVFLSDEARNQKFLVAADSSLVAAIMLGVDQSPLNDAPANTVPDAKTVAANAATAITQLAVSDVDAGSGTVTTTLSVQHGTLAIINAAAVSGNGTATVTLTGTLAQINAALSAANNVLYTPTHDFFGTDTLTMSTDDNGNSGPGGALSDTDTVTLGVGTLLIGTPGNDGYGAPAGIARIDAGGGIDTISFAFKLTDATVSYAGNTVAVDGPAGSHTVLTGFERFVFTDGTVSNDDGDVLVDDLFYYANNHDVWIAGADADAHYHSNGWHEGRDPDAFFSTAFYLATNPAVKASGADPLHHFDQAGWKEGRAPSAAFDPAAYLAANPDVKAANIDPLAHFLQSGAQEGRQPFALRALTTGNGFDYVYYLANNPDVKAAGIDPLLHFQQFGWHEGRNPNAFFDVNGYLDNYLDVKVAGINPVDHYNSFGWKEGRDPSTAFDTTAYRDAYPDIAAANINPLLHFLLNGINEGRSPFGDGVWG